MNLDSFWIEVNATGLLQQMDWNLGWVLYMDGKANGLGTPETVTRIGYEKRTGT